MASSPNSYESQTEEIRDKGQIAALLGRLQSGHTLLTVIVHGAKGQYNSMLLRLDPQQNFVLLDELTPKIGHEQLIKSRQMRIFCQLRGVHIHFSATLTQAYDTKDGLVYKIPFPAAISYQQRRSAFRVPLARGALPVTVTLEHGMILRGEAIDVSAGGVKARFPLPPNQIPYLTHGSMLERCSIQFGPKQHVRGQLEIRFFAYNEDLKELMIGGRFRDLERAEAKLLEREVMNLQREHLKKGTR